MSPKVKQSRSIAILVSNVNAKFLKYPPYFL